MELRRYLRVVRRHRWVAAIAFLATSVFTLILVSMQTPRWEATGTALITPSIQGTGPDVEAERTKAIDILSRGVKIQETYATIARSELIRDRAESTIDPGIDVSGMSVEAEVVTDTNILSFTARSHDPEAAEALGEAVMDATIAHVGALNGAYVLSPLDRPAAGSDPVGANKGLTIALGAIFGVLLAVVLALFAEYLSGNTGVDDVAVDERTGLHTTQYLGTRLREETSRADRTDGSFSLATFGVALRAGESWRTPTDPELRKIGDLLPITVRNDVVIAHLGEGEFGAILPDTDRSAAGSLVRRWEAAVGSTLEGFLTDPDAVPGFSHSVAQYRDGVFDGDREAVRMARKVVGDSVATVVRGQQSIPSGRPTPWSRSGTGHEGNGSGRGAVELAPAQEAPAARPTGSTGGSARRRSNRSKASKGKPRAAIRRR